MQDRIHTPTLNPTANPSAALPSAQTINPKLTLPSPASINRTGRSLVLVTKQYVDGLSRDAEGYHVEQTTGVGWREMRVGVHGVGGAVWCEDLKDGYGKGLSWDGRTVL